MSDQIKKLREIVITEDENGNELKLAVRFPGYNERKVAKLAYVVSFGEAVKSGAKLLAQMENYLREAHLWDDASEKELERLQTSIADSRQKIKDKNIQLTEARKLAIQAIKDRNSIQTLIAQRTSAENNTAERLAEDDQFNQLVASVVYNTIDGKLVFSDENGKSSVKVYCENADKKYALDVASKLAEMEYGSFLDNLAKLPEYQFLKKYKFVNDKFEFVDASGRRTDESGEKLIDEEGFYIDEEGNRVTYDGKPIPKDDDKTDGFGSFLDSEGNPIVED